MESNQALLGRSLLSGTAAAATTTLAAALAGRMETGSYVTPLNATSHIVWGNEAARENKVSLKYTLTGLALNYLATVMWAGVYEKWFAAERRNRGGKAPSTLQPLIGAAIVTAGAYITDYYLVPKRFTPGFEMRLSGRSLATIYGALAAGLVAGALSRRRR